MDKENKQMKQTLTYLQQELIKSGKKNIKVPEKGSNPNASWQSSTSQRVEKASSSLTEKDKNIFKIERKKKR